MLDPLVQRFHPINRREKRQEHPPKSVRSTQGWALSARSILILSLGLNLALSAWAIAKHIRASAQPSATATTAGEAPEGKPVPVSRKPRTNVTEVTTNRLDAPRFHWSQVETNDFEAYVANLRGLGCPDHTLRHLVTGEIEALYAERDAALEPSRGVWERPSEWHAREASAHRDQAALEEEKRALLRRLIGIDWSAKAEAEWVDDNTACLHIGFLPDDQAIRLVDSLGRLEKWTRAFRDETGGIVIDTDEPRLEALLVEIKRELESGLTPPEIQEATLRGICLAKAYLDSNALAGVPLTGDELRRLTALSSRDGDLLMAALRSEMDRQRNGGNQAMEELVKQVSPETESEIQALLGPQRLSAYERSKDEAFREFAGTARRLDLPLDPAVKAWEVRRAAEAAVAELKATEGIGPAERRAALEAMRRETEQAIGMAVGAQAAKEFFGPDGGWVRHTFGAPEAKR